MVSRAGLQSAPTAPAHPVHASAPMPASRRTELEQVARLAIAAAESAVNAASSQQSATQAVRDAENALQAARRIPGVDKTVLRALERAVEKVRREARTKVPETSTVHDRLARRSLGVPASARPDRQPTTRTSPASARPSIDVRLDGAAIVPPELTITRRETLHLDRPLRPADVQPHTAYDYGDYVYVTDEAGQLAYMRGIAHYTPAAPRHRSIQRNVGREAQATATEAMGKLVGGHSGAVSLGGYPSGPALFGQNERMNTSVFARFENEFRNLSEAGVRVEYEMRFATDTAGDKNPSVVILRYWVEAEERDEVILLNEPHQLS
ncbi:hypothetical protein ACFPIJ_56910 [Dactylosporangium cerinum]|uniref:Uncharacterized protein n=2 Tax=Dactylosporangium cerinum TaxID=1434730 RepID=A0ABV9WFY2_9ACTN